MIEFAKEADLDEPTSPRYGHTPHLLRVKAFNAFLHGSFGEIWTVIVPNGQLEMVPEPPDERHGTTQFFRVGHLLIDQNFVRRHKDERSVRKFRRILQALLFFGPCRFGKPTKYEGVGTVRISRHTWL